MDVTLDGLRDVRVYQNRNGYRFSVDALLLYSFVDLRHARSIVDLGAGSGIIGLLLARKYTRAHVSLVELQESLYTLAERNIRLNGLGDRVDAVAADIKTVRDILPQMSADIVVSNPPFRTPRSGRISSGDEKAAARHELLLTLQQLAEAAACLLRSKGRFFMIFHPERLIETVDALRSCKLEPKRLRFVHNDTSRNSKIALIESVKDGRKGLKVEKPLFLYDADGSQTEELNRMYGRS